MSIENTVENIDNDWPSLIQQTKCCYVCGATSGLHLHHIFYGTANRKKSDEDKMTVFLCGYHHNLSNAGIHFNKALDEKVKQQAEKIWIDTYADGDLENGIKLFIKRYGRNYLD